MTNTLEDIGAPTPKEFVVTREVGPYDEQHTSNIVMGELVAGIREHFGIERQEATEESEDQPATPLTLTMRVVCMTPQDFENFQDLEARVRDLEAELDELKDETVITDET